MVFATRPPVAVLFLLGLVLLFASGVENFAWTSYSSSTSTTTTTILSTSRRSAGHSSVVTLDDYDCGAADSSEQRRLVAQQLGGDLLPSNFVRVAAVCRDGSPLVIQTYPLAGGSRRRQARSESGGSTKWNHTSPNQQPRNPQQRQRQQQQQQLPQSTPFPTLYWLCHPQINKCVAELERRGCAAEFQKLLDGDVHLWNEWMRSHRQYARERWNSLTVDDQYCLLAAAAAAADDSGRSWSAAQSKLAILRESGISGSNLTATTTTTKTMHGGTPSVKCLHAHYAHYRASSSLLLSDEIRVSNPVGAMVHERLRVEFPDLVL